MLKSGLYAGGRQLVEHVPLVAPILEALEVAVKPCADIAVPFPNDDSPAGPCQRDGAGEAGRARADDCNGLGFASGEGSALKRAHGRPHGSKT